MTSMRDSDTTESPECPRLVFAISSVSDIQRFPPPDPLVVRAISLTADVLLASLRPASGCLRKGLAAGDLRSISWRSFFLDAAWLSTYCI